MFQKLLDDMAGALKGVDVWFFVGVLGVWIAGWFLLGVGRKSSGASRRVLFSVLVVVVTGAGIYIRHRSHVAVFRFGEDVFGVLLMGISGDDAGNSVQTELAAALGAGLQKETLPKRVEIRTSNHGIDETLPIEEGEKQAREAGGRCRATLVVWGQRVADRRAFLPQVTLVATPPLSSAVGEYDLKIQTLRNMRLPYEAAGRPVFLTRCVSAFVHCFERNHAEAIKQFEAAISVDGVLPREVADLHFHVGVCHWNLAQGQPNMETHLRWAINYFEFAAAQYGIASMILSRAMANHNLGVAYLQWPAGDKDLNMRKAIMAFETALRGRTEKDAPIEWAMTYANLAEVYAYLSSGDRTTNLKNAIAAYANALRVYTAKDHPKQYAVTQNNLGALYVKLTAGDKSANLYNAIAAYEAALEVYTKDQFPEEWALTQNNIGLAYARMPRDNRLECLTLAQSHLMKALTVLTAAHSPYYNRVITDNLTHIKNEIARLKEVTTPPASAPARRHGGVMGLEEPVPTPASPGLLSTPQ